MELIWHHSSLLPMTAKFTIPENANVSEIIEEAKKDLYQDPNIIGVGFGSRQKDHEIHEDEPALIVYVKKKLEKKR